MRFLLAVAALAAVGAASFGAAYQAVVAGWRPPLAALAGLGVAPVAACVLAVAAAHWSELRAERWENALRRKYGR